MKDITYKINRYEKYDGDTEEQSHMIVGFIIENSVNFRKKYLETTVPKTECEDKSETEICQLAFDKLKDKIRNAENNISKLPSIIGSEFIPEKTDDSFKLL